ncbi:uncharacterized protein EV420DRAFT_1526403 [Desarmillaria tabescens]|uniref:Thioredoxin-like fold domain-containing protein n=1 Tax=Armillaria tabescens TaxID=1929756 RepID=A0AA39N9R2_ARMTA|nr:uncharacterized protein EV420DRAFT_1526403 [Desarmillaria tabescens]KAK0461642.1 hypothetical protein EV420DRAFT_1526403 [Desarmillaria tabescens]
MKYLTVYWLALLCSLSLARAQYFSEGWTPGQAVPSEVPIPNPASTPVPADSQEESAPLRPSDLLKLFEAKTWLASEPAVALFSRFGINITERLAAAEVLPWDSRIPLITDDNYEEMIVKEELTEEEEAERVWALLISASASRQDGISKFVDDAFDEAYNQTLLAEDLPNVRWGRIDYFNVTYITTKWGVWQAPFIVILTDRGQTLRFYRAQNLRLRDGALHDFLKAEAWKVTPPWKTAYAPGGEREYIVDFVATWMTKIYNVTVRLPRFILLLLSGTAGSLVIGLMHRKPPKQAVQKTEPASQPASAPTAGTSTATPSKPATKQRKSKK